MWVDLAFTASSVLAASGWILLLTGDRWPTAQRAWAGLAVPLLLATAYAAIFPALYVHAPGGYGSVDELVKLLTSDRRVALAAWLHYLAFDLLIGGSIVVEARALGLAARWRIPALALTFLFGPAGWLWFRAQREWRHHQARRQRAPSTNPTGAESP